MIIIFLSFIHILFLSQLQFTAWPEMLSYPYLLLKGFSLYKDFVLPYPPGLIFYLTLFYKLLGLNILTLKIATWTLIVLTDICLFITLKKITASKPLSIFLICCYFIAQSLLEGNMLWFDFATVLPLLLAHLFLIKWISSKRKHDLLFAGASLAVAFLVKQISVIYFGFIFSYLIIIRARKNEFGAFLLGAILFLTPFLIFLLATSSVVPFLNWSLIYPMTQWSKFPGYIQLNLERSSIYLLIALSLPLLSGFFVSKRIFRDQGFLICCLFSLGAVLAIYPRFSFFHFQSALAFLTILIAYLTNYLSNKKFIAVGLLTLSSGLILGYLLPSSLGGGTRFYDQSDKSVSQLIGKYTNPEQTILLINLHSNQYSFTQTLPPKPWLDNFGWYLEVPGVQGEALSKWQKNLPEVIFRRKTQQGNWFDLGTYEPKLILKYITSNYQKIAEEDNIEVWRKK